MSADTFIQLPVETGNTGKKLKVQSRTQGADTVHAHYTIPQREGVVVDVFSLASMVLTALSLTAHNGTTTGFLWITNPAASAKNLRIRRASLMYNFIGVTTLTTIPRMLLQRFTWTGTPSGASLAATAIEDVSNVTVADIRTASTGMTVTLLGSPVAIDLPPMAQVSGTAATFAMNPTIRSEMVDTASEDEWIVLTPGQGLVLYQGDVGGATAETRRFVANILFDEVNPVG
jgi:hypothetical protein